MSDTFTCPNCRKVYDVGELEFWELYESEGKETEFTCDKCEKELIILSEVIGWNFEVEVNE